MVVISECFPSDHEVVNKARESYRESVQLSADFQVIHESDSIGDDGIANRTSSDENISDGDLETLLDESKDDIKTVMDKYPGGFREFLKNSKNHLNRSQNIDETIRTVQQLVARMNSVRPDNAASAESTSNMSVFDIIPPAERQNYRSELADLFEVSDQTTETLFDQNGAKSENLARTQQQRQVSDDENTRLIAEFIKKHNIRPSSVKLLNSARANKRSRKKIDDSSSSASGTKSARQLPVRQQQTNSTIAVKTVPKRAAQKLVQTTEQLALVPGSETMLAYAMHKRFSSVINKTKYNGTAPRYLDVFNKALTHQQAPKEKKRLTPTVPSGFAGSGTGPDHGQATGCHGHGGRFNSTPFEHNWTELPVPVVTIQF